MRLRSLFTGSIQRAFINLLVITLIPILVVQAGVFGALLQLERNDQLESNLELARLLSNAVEDYYRDIVREERILGGVLTDETVDADAQAAALAFADASFPSVSSFLLVTPQGTVVAASDPEFTGASIANLPTFQQITGGAETAVSNVTPGPVTGEPRVIIATGIREGETLQGIVVALIDPANFSQILTIQEVRGEALVIIDRAGQRVYRQPEVASPLEERGPDAAAALQRALAGEEVATVITSPITGRRVFAGFAPIPPFGWVAVATQDATLVTAPFFRAFLIEFGLVLLAAGLALGVYLWVSHQITDPIIALRDRMRAFDPRRSEPPAPVGGPAEVHDLSEAFTQMAATLKEREEERETYQHTISHDLRTPLTIAQGHLQLAEAAVTGHDEEEEILQSLDAATRALRQMNVLIRDLADSARAAGGQLVLQRHPVDLATVIANYLTQAEAVFDLTRLEVNIPDDLPPVDADPARLERIIANLLSNALKYSEPGTPITLCAVPRNHHVLVTITDQGMGIPPEDIPRLFKRYYRSSTSRRREGIGLGLYITRLLVEAHGGHIGVRSTPGEGSTFWFTLPMAKAQDAAT